MYSIPLVFDGTPGVDNLLYDPEKGKNVWGVRVVAVGKVALADYDAITCAYQQTMPHGNSDPTVIQREFRIDSSDSFRAAGPNGDTSPMEEPKLLNATDGSNWEVWVFESPLDRIEGDGTGSGGGGGGGGGGGTAVTFKGPFSPAGNAAPVDSDTSGIDLSSVTALAMIAAVAAGSTLNANTGYLEAWIRGPGLTFWARCPDLDLAVGGFDSTNQGWAARSVPISGGRICYLPRDMVITGVGTEVFLSYVEAF